MSNVLLTFLYPTYHFVPDEKQDNFFWPLMALILVSSSAMLLFYPVNLVSGLSGIAYGLYAGIFRFMIFLVYGLKALSSEEFELEGLSASRRRSFMAWIAIWMILNVIAVESGYELFGFTFASVFVCTNVISLVIPKKKQSLLSRVFSRKKKD